jgi:hypothetical protein
VADATFYYVNGRFFCHTCAMSKPPDRVYYVSEQSTGISIKSVLITQESERAFTLQEVFISAPLNRPKKILIKGFDLIALSESEALVHYLNQMRQQIVDLEFSLARTQQFIEYATEAQRTMTESAKAPIHASGISSAYLSDHPDPPR